MYICIYVYVYIYHILTHTMKYYSVTKEGNLTICNNKDGPRGYYTKREVRQRRTNVV